MGRVGRAAVLRGAMSSERGLFSSDSPVAHLGASGPEAPPQINDDWDLVMSLQSVKIVGSRCDESVIR
jgi:hypothetical protein